jgi:hypothetical protein
MAANKPEMLRPEVARAQKKLEAAMDEACESDVDVKKANTAELIRIEESLALASTAAREAISVRQKLRQRRDREEKVFENHRIFDDARGRRWEVFAVHPSSVAAGRTASLPDPYQRGWLSFDSGVAGELRRLAPIPDGWSKLPDEGLRKLWEKAEVAPRRKSPLPGPSKRPPEASR